MATIPSDNFLAQNELVPLPSNTRNTFDFIFSSPFTKGSPTWKTTPKHLQHHALPGPIPEEKPIFRDGITGESEATSRSCGGPQARWSMGMGGLRDLCRTTSSPLPAFTTGAALSYGRLRSDALKVSSSLVLGPLDLKPGEFCYL